MEYLLGLAIGAVIWIAYIAFIILAFAIPIGLVYRLVTGPKRKCPKCHEYIPKKALTCSHCGASMVKAKEGQSYDDAVRAQITANQHAEYRKSWVIGVIIVAVMLMLAIL